MTTDEAGSSRHDLNKTTPSMPLTREQLYTLVWSEPMLKVAARCVPEGPSVACSTPTAIAWDAAFAKLIDPSGRAVTDVHKDGYKEDKPC